MELSGIAGIAIIPGAATMKPMEWLTSERKLDAVVLDHMGVKGVKHPALGDCVAFQYQEEGKPNAAKFRTVEKRWSSTKGVTRGLYNANALTKNTDQPIVITEGEIDCISVVQSGYDRAVSLPDGWTEKGDKRDVLIQYEELLKNSPYVIAAGDNDKAGVSFPKTLANILLGHDVRYVEWPDHCKDANDVLVKHGEGVLNDHLHTAKRIDPPGGFITGLSDLPPLPNRRVLRTGIEWVDKRLAFEVGAMSVGTGTPGAGKSTFTTWALYHTAIHEEIKVGFMSFETHPHRTRDHFARLITKTPFDNLAGPQLQSALDVMDKHFRLVHRTYGENDRHALKFLREMVYTLAVRDGCKIIVVDPWNELEHMPEPGESLTNYINWALQQIRTWADRFDVHICVVAHPKKIDSYNGKIRPPLGYDIADSAAFSNKPALGFTVHQEALESGASFSRILTWKVRDTQLYGIQKGSSDATFDIDAMTYYELITNEDGF